MECTFKIGDKVVVNGKKGPIGVVKEIRIETMRTSAKEKDKEGLGMSVTVIWDNGTISHFVPEALEKLS